MDDVGWLFRAITLIVLLIFSALFSGSEVALFSLDEKKIDSLNKESGLLNKYINKLLSNPKNLLITILIGNTIANVATSIISVSLAIDIAKLYNYNLDFVLLVQIIVLTIIIILFAEITPKVWANKHPINFSKLIAFPLFWINIIISPFSNIISNTILFATSKVKYDKSRTALSASEITELADIGVEKGTIEEEEHGLIHALVSFKSVTVREVMTPRVDMVTVSTDISLKELIDIIKESGHSRIPMYDEDMDNISGIIYAKDLLPYLNKTDSDSDFDLKKISRDCIFVPDTKLISDLMQEFQTKNMHMSVVVDEYGGTAGLITLEDILEEIVGEIRDEFDNEEDYIQAISEDKFLMSGKADLDEIEDTLNITIDVPDEDFETLGGFIFNHAGEIPEIGYSFEEYGYHFKVAEIENNRINKVEIKKVSKES